METIKLEAVSQKNFHLIEGITLPPEQEANDGTDSFYKLLAQAYVNLDDHIWSPLLAIGQPSQNAIGRICLVLPQNRSMCSLCGVAISQSYQGQGYGSQLMQATISHIGQAYPEAVFIGLYVFEDNIPAVKLYKKSGFIPTGEKSDEHGIVMRRRLP